MILDKIKKLMGLGSIPDEVAPIYKGAKSEKEALELLRDARRRDEDRRNRALEDVERPGVRFRHRLIRPHRNA